MTSHGDTDYLTRLIRDEQGQDVIEYALLTAGIGLAGIAVWPAITAAIGVRVSGVRHQHPGHLGNTSSERIMSMAEVNCTRDRRARVRSRTCAAPASPTASRSARFAAGRGVSRAWRPSAAALARPAARAAGRPARVLPVLCAGRPGRRRREADGGARHLDRLAAGASRWRSTARWPAACWRVVARAVARLSAHGAAEHRGARPVLVGRRHQAVARADARSGNGPAASVRRSRSWWDWW